MKLTKEEKKLLINAKDESDWYSICTDIKDRRNGIYPNYLAREILDIYQNKFPVNKYKEWAILETQLNRKSFISWLSIGWLAFVAATGGFFTAMIRFLFPNVLFEPPQTFKIGFPDDFESGKVDDNTRVVLRTLFDKVNEYLRKIEEELPSEHAKKRECAEIIQAMSLDEKVLERIQELPRTLGRPLKGEPLGRFLIRIGASKLWDAFKYVQHEHSDGNMGGMGKDFFNGMKYGFNNKGADMDAGEVIKIMRVWNLANQLGYSDHYPGENDLYLVR